MNIISGRLNALVISRGMLPVLKRKSKLTGPDISEMNRSTVISNARKIRTCHETAQFMTMTLYNHIDGREYHIYRTGDGLEVFSNLILWLSLHLLAMDHLNYNFRCLKAQKRRQLQTMKKRLFQMRRIHVRCYSTVILELGTFQS